MFCKLLLIIVQILRALCVPHIAHHDAPSVLSSSGVSVTSRKLDVLHYFALIYYTQFEYWKSTHWYIYNSCSE